MNALTIDIQGIRKPTQDLRSSLMFSGPAPHSGSHRTSYIAIAGASAPRETNGAPAALILVVVAADKPIPEVAPTPQKPIAFDYETLRGRLAQGTQRIGIDNPASSNSRQVEYYTEEGRLAAAAVLAQKEMAVRGADNAFDHARFCWQESCRLETAGYYSGIVNGRLVTRPGFVGPARPVERCTPV